MNKLPARQNTTPITDADVSWALPISPCPERITPAMLALLPHQNLLAFTISLQADVRSLRTVLCESLSALAEVTRDRDRLRHAVRHGRR